MLIATSPNTLCDELEVVMALRNGSGNAVDVIRERLRDELKVAVAVRVGAKEEIDSLQGSKELRKKRIFVDRRGG